MNESVKVFRMPDGKGGTRYQIMTAHGEWLDTDENGNLLQKDVGLPEPAPVKGAQSKGKKSKPYVNLTVKVHPEEYDLITKYTYWHSYHRKPVSRSSLARELMLERIRKDREFQDFLKR